MYNKYKDITFKQFEQWLNDHWVNVDGETIRWYISDADKIESYWEIWKPLVIYNIIIPTMDYIAFKERKRKEWEAVLYRGFPHWE